MNADILSILEEAGTLIYGQREKDYGSPTTNLSRIAALWHSYILAKHGVILDITPEDVCWMMVQLKMARDMEGQKKRDTIVDAAGYIGLIERVRENTNERY